MADGVERDEIDEAQAIDVPEFYVNAFANYLSSGDILTVLQRNGRPAAILNMSLPIAKAFSESLATLIANHERSAGYILNPHVEVKPDEGGDLS